MQMWFGEDWQSVPGDVAGYSALESFVFKLQSFPSALFADTPVYPSLNFTAFIMPGPANVTLPEGQELNLDINLADFSLSDYYSDVPAAPSGDYDYYDASLTDLADAPAPVVVINGKTLLLCSGHGGMCRICCPYMPQYPA